MSERGEHESWLAQHAPFAARTALGENEAVCALRAEALSHARALGLPTTRDEDWRYTRLAGVAKHSWTPAPAAPDSVSRDALEEAATPLFACSLHVFVDGHYAAALSTPAAGPVQTLAALRRESSASLQGFGALAPIKRSFFAAWNTAFCDDGAVVRIPRGEQHDDPVHLVFVSTGQTARAAQPRILVHAETGSHAVLLVDHVSLPGDGGGASLSNCVVEAQVDANAALDLVLLQRESKRAFHFSNTSARVARDGRFRSHTLSLGNALVRNDLDVQLTEPGASCQLNGLFLAGSDQHVDNYTNVDHASPHGTSDELYKGILAGNARGVFRGRVVVRPDAQKTSATQSNPNLLLDDAAEINSKPQLQIHADDVKCSHGSTIGQLDEDALFYLRARGIDSAAAKALLTEGFANEVADALPAAALSERVRELVREGLGS